MPRILVYGDSNSYGTPPMAERGLSARFPFEQRWPSVMAASLGQGYEVTVSALPGRTTVHDDPIDGAFRNGLSVLPAVLHSYGPQDLVILFLGTNDLKMRFNVPAVDIALSMGKLAETVHASGVAEDLMLVCPPTVREVGCLAGVFEGAEARGAGMFVHMMQEAARLGVGFVDAGAHIAVDPLDGVHFSPSSHAILGRAMAHAVRDRVKRRAQGAGA